MKSYPMNDYINLADLQAIAKKHPINYVGKFKVIHQSCISSFDILDQAVAYYNMLQEDASIWDVTNHQEFLLASRVGN